MTVSTIDGEVREAAVKRVYKKITHFERIVIAGPGGIPTELKRHHVANELAPHIHVGARGRFYVATAMDVKALHAVRLDDGTTMQAWPGNNAKMFLAIAIIGIAILTASIVFGTSVSLFTLIPIALGIPGYFLTKSAMTAAKRQFEADQAVARAAPSA